MTITNNSTVSDAASLSWWFYIVAPSGDVIHGTDLTSEDDLPTPDVDGVEWTTKTYSLPTPFGNRPCGQVEFSPNVPYSLTVYVEDSAGSPIQLESLTKTAIIVRPNGNQGWSGGKTGTCGNFGIATVAVNVNCANKASAIRCSDITDVTYNNLQPLTPPSNIWTMQYPQDPGDVPNKTATNTPNVNFPATVDSQAYTLYFNNFATYDYGNGVTVKVQYKLYNKQGSLGYTFPINCNVNLCQLVCQMRALRLLATQSCGKLEYPDLLNKITILNLLFSEIIASIMQPLCGNDVPGMVAEWKALSQMENGDCGCGTGFFGFGNPTGSGEDQSGLAPIFVPISDNSTSPPGGCLSTFSPSEVFDPTSIVSLGMADTVSDMLTLINSNAAWQAYGTAFDSGGCLVGFFPLYAGITIPDVTITSSGEGVAWRQGGNSFGETGVFGTKDSNPVNFIIADIVKAILSSDSFALSATPILVGTGTISAPVNAVVIDPATKTVKVYVSSVLVGTYGSDAVISGNATINGGSLIIKDTASAFAATIITAVLNANYAYRVPSGGGTFQMRKQVIYQTTPLDCRSTGATKIFTSDALASGRFIVTDVIAITKNVSGGGGNAVFNIGFTSATYADTVLDGTTTNTTNSPQFQTLVANCLSIPNATDVFVNVTTASTRSLFDVGFYVIGFYELLSFG